ncbi:MAG: methyltransferase domain-containing protein [Candidatus Omnitrophica bacterium]|nr:methyltransferase domain-containing protein [Candidatus Omnitrophota bacterium]
MIGPALLGEIVRPICRLINIVLGKPRIEKLIKRKPRKIIVGASGVFQRGWVSIEKEFLNLLRPEDWKRYFLENSIDAILAEHVWEHLTREEGILAAKLCYRYLKPGGYLRVAVPDGLHPDLDYIERVRPGGFGYSSWDHKLIYTHKTLKEIFELAGFRIELLEYFDEKGLFHYKEWNPTDGMIRRSKRFDIRNRKGKLKIISIILDANK